MTSPATPAAQASLLEAAAAVGAAFERASARAVLTSSTYSVAGLTVKIDFAGRLAEQLMPGLEHLASDAGTPDLTIRAFDSISTETAPPLNDDALAGLIPAGLPGARQVDGFRAAYRRPDSGLTLLDVAAGKALYWVGSAANVPYWERAAPFRGIFSSFTGARGKRFVHAAAVGTGDSAVLLAGPGGSGKSTTALTCLAAGMDYAGDDYCVVDVPELRVFGLYRSAKLHPANVERIPWLAGAALNEGDLNEKLTYFPAPTSGGTMRQSMRISTIVLPRVTGASGPRLTPATGATALAAIAPTTLLQLTPTNASALRDLALLARSVPVYSLELGGRMEQVPALLKDLL